MATEPSLAERVERALQADTKLEMGHAPLWVTSTDGSLTIEGEVAEMSSKRRAFARVAALPGVVRIFDRVRVRASAAMEDGAIRDHVRDQLLGEPAFDACSIVVVRDGNEALARDRGTGASGVIRVRAEHAVVGLEGRVPSRVHHRLAEVLAWWVPGTVAVDNALEIAPFEEDSDDELREAVRIVLEKEPFVDDAQIVVSVRRRAVTLRGYLPSDEQRGIAERDTWYVPGVVDVANEIEVIH